MSVACQLQARKRFRRGQPVRQAKSSNDVLLIHIPFQAHSDLWNRCRGSLLAIRSVFVAGRLPEHDLSGGTVKEPMRMGVAVPDGLTHTLFDGNLVPRACRTTRDVVRHSTPTEIVI